MGDKKIKRGIYILCFSLIIILTLSMVSAGALKDFYNKMTGKATTANVQHSITVTGGRAPVIIGVYNNTMTDLSAGNLNEGPTPTYSILIIGVQDQDGIGNLNNATATVNYSKSGEATRTSSTCTFIAGQSTATTANYTCNTTVWWYDGPLIWGISAFITDVNGNNGYNATVKNFTLTALDGVTANQTSITWPSINPGSTAINATTFMGLNNTGNRPRVINVNATDLIGVTISTQALGANNFTVKDTFGCGGTAMINKTAVNITSANLERGNFTFNNLTAQERLFYCLEQANADLTAQVYSTGARPWIVTIASS